MRKPFERIGRLEWKPNARWSNRYAVGMIVISVMLVASGADQPAALASQVSGSGAGAGNPSRVTPHSLKPRLIYPTGSPDGTAPSGEAPPTPSSMPGYKLTNLATFDGTSLPAGWDVFTGSPGSDPGAQWGKGHVQVSGGLLQLNTFKDPAYNNAWVSGGLCDCGAAQIYGAYFVRSRMTGPGPTQVELLWPMSGWPPEVDFNETYGDSSASMATDHFGPANHQVQRTVNVDMTQWHTWGVVWTPTSLTYVLDGRVWGAVTGAGEIPNQPMTLNLQQQTWCSSGWACPTAPQSMLVDWVAQFTPLGHQTMSVGPFSTGKSTITSAMRSQIAAVALRIKTDGNPMVSLTGYSDPARGPRQLVTLGRTRVLAVASLLRRQLASLNVTGVNISVNSVGLAAGSGAAPQSTAGAFFSRVRVTLS